VKIIIKQSKVIKNVTPGITLLNHVTQQHKTNARLPINTWSSSISLQSVMLGPFSKKFTAIYGTKNFITMLDMSPLKSERQQFRVPTLTIYFLKKRKAHSFQVSRLKFYGHFSTHPSLTS